MFAPNAGTVVGEEKKLRVSLFSLAFHYILFPLLTIHTNTVAGNQGRKESGWLILYRHSFCGFPSIESFFRLFTHFFLFQFNFKFAYPSIKENHLLLKFPFAIPRATENLHGFFYVLFLHQNLAKGEILNKNAKFAISKDAEERQLNEGYKEFFYNSNVHTTT